MRFILLHTRCFAMASLSNILGPPTPPPRIAYNPNRITPAQSVLIPISAHESFLCESTLNPLHSKKPRPLPASPPPQLVPHEQIGHASLPQKPQTQSQPNERSNKRAPPQSFNDQPRKRAHADVAVVADYCEISPLVAATLAHFFRFSADNARPNTDRVSRESSPIIGLKNFNNWVKSVFIAKFCRKSNEDRIKVLDLGCGKGGDLQKWQKAGTDEYIGVGASSLSQFPKVLAELCFVATDLAAISIEQAASRWENLRDRFKAAFFVLDCYQRPLTDVLLDVHTNRSFDVVSMQFCIHYAFENEEKARMMLENVTRFLATGGLLVGTMPDSRNLLFVLHLPLLHCN